MPSLADPLQIAAVSAAVLWPLALGASLVVWTKARAAERRRRLSVIDGHLQGLFGVIQAQPAPERLELVVETLEEHAGALAKAGEPPAAAGLKPAPTS